MKELSLQGKNPEQIAQELNSSGILTRGTVRGKGIWLAPTVAKILVRERQPRPKPKKILPQPVLEIPLDDPLMSEGDKEFWKDVYREVAKGPLPVERKPKSKHPLPTDYKLIETDRGGV